MAKYKANFIFWVTEDGFLRLAREAPDFFSRITGAKFDFKITLDLFCEKKIADNSGFKVCLRMVAHCGYATFWLNEKGKKIDFAGSCGIKVFRLEKEAHEVRILGIHAPADQFFGIIISLLMVLIMVYLSLWNFLRATED